MVSAKEKIKTSVDEYIKLFPDEFEAFKTAIHEKREATTGFAEVGGTEIIQRALYELPEVLYYALRRTLTNEEWWWFQGDTQRGADRNQGPGWFVRTFPVFKITKEY